MRASVSVYVFYTSLNMIDIHVGHLTFIITIIIIIIIITIIDAILGSDWEMFEQHFFQVKT